MIERTTRPPTGIPSFPMVLLAGIQGGGKSYAAAVATGLFDHAFWIEYGENTADAYGEVPGQNYRLIEPVGQMSYDDLLGSVQYAAQQSHTWDRPGCLVIDSLSVLWDNLKDEVGAAALARAIRKGRRIADGEEPPKTPDLWNKARTRFFRVLGAARKFNGLVILTARLEDQAVIVGGEPTGARQFKALVPERALFAVDVIAQARAPREWSIAKVQSVRMQLPPGEVWPFEDFTIEKLLSEMGISLDGKGTAARGDNTPILEDLDADFGGDEPTDPDAAPAPHREAVQVQQKIEDTPPIPAQRRDLVALLDALVDFGDIDGIQALWRTAKREDNRTALTLINAAGYRARAAQQTVNTEAAGGEDNEVADLAARAGAAAKKVTELVDAGASREKIDAAREQAHALLNSLKSARGKAAKGQAA